MKLQPTFCCLVLAAFVVAGCKKEAPASMSATSSAPSPAPPAAPASSAPSATVSTSSSGGASSADSTARLTGVEWAMKQDEIKNDARGQWAIAATASSSYGDAQGQASWSPNQVTGAPNVEKYGDDGHAWTSKEQDAGIEWLDLKYPKAVHAEEIRVRESYSSGAVVKMEVFDEQNGAHTVWAGNDPTKDLNYLMVKFPKTAFKTDRVKITLATNVVAGWNEIDAVQLVGSDQ